AGVSSFGFGGTNFHVVLEEYSPDCASTEQDWMPRPAEVVVFQRAGREEIRNALSRLEKQLTSTATENRAGLSAALLHEESNRTSNDRCARLAIIAHSIEDLRQKVGKAFARLAAQTEVNEPGGIYYSEAPAAKASQVCFLYPGQGSQAVNMLRDLVAGSPW